MDGESANHLLTTQNTLDSETETEDTYDVWYEEADQSLDTAVVKLQDKFKEMSLNSTLVSTFPVAVSAVTTCTQHPATPPKDVILEDIVFEEVQLCDKYDTKELSADTTGMYFRTAHMAQEVPGGMEKGQERSVTNTKEKKASPWIDGLGWYKQIRRLENRLEINRQYEEEINAAEGQFIASAVMVSPSDIEVRVHAEVEGNEVSGTWFLLQGLLPTSNAWVGLFPHRSTKSYVDFVYATGTAGEFRFRGVTPGHYQVRLFGGTFITSKMAETELLFVGPKVSKFIAQVEEEKELVLFYYDFENFPVSARDWVAIYEKGQRSNKSYLSCAYGNSHGVLQIKLPHARGEYEARLFAAGSKYNEQAKVEFTVEDHDFLEAEQVEEGLQIKWSMNRAVTSTSDWIGLYKAGTPSTNYVTYIYTHGTHAGERILRIPKTFPKGAYQLRIFAAKTGKYMSHKGCNICIN